MTDIDLLATALYGSTTAPPEGTTSTPATPPVEPWSGNPKDIENFGADHPRPAEMYAPEIASRPVMQQHQDTLRDVLGYGQAQLHSHNRAHVALLRETGLDAATVGAKLYETGVQALVAHARGDAPDDNRQQALEETIRRELRETYGAARAEPLQRAFVKFVEAHPRLRQLIGMEGFGAQPSAKQALDALIEFVRQRNRI